MTFDAVPGLLDAVEPPEYRGIARDEVRLLVTHRRTRRHEHRQFVDLPQVLAEGDLLVVNDSATIPAALSACGQAGEIAVHVATQIGERLWLVEPRGNVCEGQRLQLEGGASVVMLAPLEPLRPRLWYASFDLPVPMLPFLARFGTPIRYQYVTRQFPIAAYQTIFARNPGSAEMPSAARPFTQRTLTALAKRGIEIAAITLHCGVASFEAPERPSLERFEISPSSASTIDRARRAGRRIIAVGTTVVRALESATRDGRTVACSGWTDLVIDAERSIASADAMLTGFHDSGATHQWMLRAFVDGELLDEAYALAAKGGYRQHEFGDVHLVI